MIFQRFCAPQLILGTQQAREAVSWRWYFCAIRSPLMQMGKQVPRVTEASGTCRDRVTGSGLLGQNWLFLGHRDSGSAILLGLGWATCIVLVPGA